MEPTPADMTGGVNDCRMASKPLLNGTKAAPQPAMVPQMIGPKTGIVNSDGGIVVLANTMNLTTT